MNNLFKNINLINIMNIDNIITILVNKYKLKKYEKDINIYNYIYTISNIMKEYIIDNINQFIFDDNYLKY